MTSAEPRKLPNQDRAKATVTAILDATAHILAETALVGAVAVRHSETMAGIVAAAVEGSIKKDLPNLVRTLIGATLRAHAENPKLRQAIVEELPSIGRPARLAELKKSIIRSVSVLLSEHRLATRIDDTDMAAFVIVSLVEHLSHVAQKEGSGLKFGRLERELNTLVLSYLTGKRA
jgi:Tetracyclin repressor-like, C-terminal domain